MNSSDNPATTQSPKDHVAEQPQPAPLGGLRRVVIEVISQDQQRYATAGDWFYDDEGVLHIKATQYPDPRYGWAVAFHELIEALTCTQAGITYQQVDEFDMGVGADLDEPGHDPRAPYHRQHILAMAMERKLITHLGVDWDTYDKEVSDKGV